ncbi:hypothetical protein ABKV33_07690 [Enterobacter ludwigii]|uniref:hypothetical protein n=1 Tax=Enterobacter ludwigii TaxID=299767 RepID=UPI0032AFF771
MAEKIINLSGRATDVLYALFFRGALHSGNLPSKSGAAELRELGFAETRHTATEYLKTNHFTYLTAEGQEFAIENLVKTRFGVPVGGYLGETSGKLYSAGIVISNEGGQRKVTFEADRFKKHETAEPISSIASATGKATKTRLTDEMQELVVKAVRESDLFTSLQAAQAASTVDLQQAVDDAVGKALRNAMRPGGAIWSAISH